VTAFQPPQQGVEPDASQTNASDNATMLAITDALIAAAVDHDHGSRFTDPSHELQVVDM
jgi:hypothetical protein